MKKQASSRYCFVCGVKNEHGLKLGFFEDEPGTVVANFTICDGHQGYPGVVHGGVIAAILDEAAGRAFMNGSPPRFMVTVSLFVRYRRPVPVGKPLKAVGRAVEDNGRITKAKSHLLGSDGTLLAEAEVVLAEIPAAMTNTMQIEADDWRVYSDGEEQ